MGVEGLKQGHWPIEEHLESQNVIRVDKSRL